MKRYSMVTGGDSKRQRADDHISVSQLEYRRVRDTLGLAKLELTSTRTSSKTLDELRYTHPIRALELAEAAEIVARRSTELAQRLRCISDASRQHESWLPLEMWRHIMRFLPRHYALLGVTRELTALVMSEYRGTLRLCSLTLFRTHKGGRKEEIPTWCNFAGATLALHETVQHDEWRLVCSTLSTLFSAERFPPNNSSDFHYHLANRKLVLTGGASSFLENYDSVLNVDALDVGVDCHTFPALCAMSGTARILRIRGVAGLSGISMLSTLQKVQCSAYMLDASATDMAVLRRILKASMTSETWFSHLFLPTSLVASNLDALDCDLFLRVEALHINITQIDNFQFASLARILRNSAALRKLYIYTDGYRLDNEHGYTLASPRVVALNKTIASYKSSHGVADFKALYDSKRLTFVIHIGSYYPISSFDTITHGELQSKIGEALPYHC